MVFGEQSRYVLYLISLFPSFFFTMGLDGKWAGEREKGRGKREERRAKNGNGFVMVAFQLVERKDGREEGECKTIMPRIYGLSSHCLSLSAAKIPWVLKIGSSYQVPHHSTCNTLLSQDMVCMYVCMYEYMSADYIHSLGSYIHLARCRYCSIPRGLGNLYG